MNETTDSSEDVAAKPSTTRTITLEILRYNPEKDEEPSFQSFDVPCRDDWVVLDGINYIKDEVDGSLSTEAARGQELFFAQGCGTCHGGATLSDGLLHDVGTALRPEEQLGGRFDTPSLLGLFDTAPYLHDGSAASLADLLRGSPLPHGVGGALDAEELEALIAFLISLP